MPKDRLWKLFLQQFKAYPLDIPSMAKKALASLLLSFSVYTAAGQTTYLQLNSEDYHLLDRLETRSGELTNSFFTSIKPIPRNGAVEFLLEKRNQLSAGLDAWQINPIGLHGVFFAASGL